MKAAAFWDYVDDSGGPSECWPWMRYRNADGYGRLSLEGRTSVQYAHRTAYVLAIGSINAGLLVCHSCDNPPCCNPAHLFLGTQGDNQADKIAKGRGNHPRLTGAEVRVIRDLSGMSVNQLGPLFPHVSLRTIYRVRAAVDAYAARVA